MRSRFQLILVTALVLVSSASVSVCAHNNNYNAKARATSFDEQSYALYNVSVQRQACIPPALSFAAWIRWYGKHDVMKSFAPLVDKSAVKVHVARLTPWVETPTTLLVVRKDNIDDILSFSFPDSFAFKAVHGSNMNIIVRNGVIVSRSHQGERYTPELLVEAARLWLSWCYNCHVERQYQAIVPGVVIEELIDFDDGVEMEYKFYVFGGMPACILVKNNTFNTARGYWPSWQPLEALYMGKCFGGFRPCSQVVPRPANYLAMLKAAVVLGAAHRFVRVDLYHTRRAVIFGELTFTPGAGEELLDRIGPLQHNRAAAGVCDSADQTNT